MSKVLMAFSVLLSYSQLCQSFAVGNLQHLPTGSRKIVRNKLLHLSVKDAIEDDNRSIKGRSGFTQDIPGMWPCMDALDQRLIKIALPVIANFAINPLIGAVDLFWVNRMGNALAVAGVSAVPKDREIDR